MRPTDIPSLDAVAEGLWQAQREGGRVRSPTARVPGLDLDDAYAIQRAFVERHGVAGGPGIGWKVGMASAVGRGPSTPGPIYGRLLSGMVVKDGAALRCAGLHEPHVEGEIALVLAAPLRGPGVEVADVLNAAEGVRPAIEVFARRLERTATEVPDMVADNALAAHAVLGAELTPVDEVDLRLIGLVLRRGETILATGAGAQVLGHPAASVAWLANALAEQEVGLAAGDVVLTGAVAGAHSAQPGDVFTAELDRLGSVSVRFS